MCNISALELNQGIWHVSSLYEYIFILFLNKNSFSLSILSHKFLLYDATKQEIII